MARSAASAAREKVRARSERKRSGRRAESEDGCVSGHPALYQIVPAFELTRQPEGGGYPVGMVDEMARLMGVTNLAEVVHLCSGSIRAPRTFDLRCGPGCECLTHNGGIKGIPKSKAGRLRVAQARRKAREVCPVRLTRCLADVRRLPLRDASVRWIMADPPYDQEYAEEMWRTGKSYPTPTVLLSECARVLRPGGKVALLHHQVPILPPGLERVRLDGVSTGPGYRLRSLTIARRTDQPLTLFEETNA